MNPDLVATFCNWISWLDKPLAPKSQTRKLIHWHTHIQFRTRLVYAKAPWHVYILYRLYPSNSHQRLDQDSFSSKSMQLHNPLIHLPKRRFFTLYRSRSTSNDSKVVAINRPTWPETIQSLKDAPEVLDPRFVIPWATVDGRNLANQLEGEYPSFFNGVSKIKDGAGCLPSTVCSIARSIQFHKNSKAPVKILEMIDFAWQNPFVYWGRPHVV